MNLHLTLEIFVGGSVLMNLHLILKIFVGGSVLMNFYPMRSHFFMKTRDIKWLIGKYFPLSLENKTLIYKTILKPIWPYGIELWGCVSKSNIAIM